MYNFDELVDRKNTNCLKYDSYKQFYGEDDLLPMWVADMDFKTPDFVMEAIKNRCNHPILGYFEHSKNFYDSIMQWMAKRHHWTIERDWISFSPGIVTGLAVLVQAFTQQGDKIIVQPPVYHPFYYVVENQGRTIVRNPLVVKDNTYCFDFEDLENKLKQGAKMLLLSNPHNPVGRCWSKAELQTLAEMCLKYNCILVSDEIHSDLTMLGYTHTVTASISEAIANNTITCMAPSKTFNLAGLSTSEIIISNKLLREQFLKVFEDGLHIHLGNIFGDVALEAAYSHGEEWLEELRTYLTENVRFAQSFIQDNLKGVQTYSHQATYLLWVNFSQWNLSTELLSERFIKKGKLAFNEGTLFGPEGAGCMRINLACPLATVKEAMNRIKQLYSSL